MISPHPLVANLVIIAHIAGVLAQTEIDPRDVPERNILGYIPSVPLAVLTGIIFLVVVAVWIGWSMKIWARYMLTLIISGTFYAFGLFMRIPYGKNTGSLSLYIAMHMITLLSPCGFIATVYMLLGRLSEHLKADEYLIIKRTIITKLFVTSDIVTLLIQGGGGGMMTSVENADLGEKILIMGLIVQFLSFIFYFIVLSIFLYRLRINRPHECRLDFSEPGFFGQWTMLAGSMFISCIGIIIRSIFRTIEGAQGHGGYLATHEAYFYILDVLPLFVATAVFAVTWPPLYTTVGYKTMAANSSSMEMGGLVRS